MSGKWPTATRTDHQRFCEIEGWEQTRNARGKSGSHHVTYELLLADGHDLRARISYPVDRSDYGTRLWSHILRDQLEVDEPTFWVCVKDDQPPARPPARSAPRSTQDPLPASLVATLLHTLRLNESEVAAMTKAEALTRLKSSGNQVADRLRLSRARQRN
jgi:hypothetical protein